MIDSEYISITVEQYNHFRQCEIDCCELNQRCQILTQDCGELTEVNNKLAAQCEALSKKNSELAAQCEALSKDNSKLRTSYKELQRMQFGRSSEKTARNKQVSCGSNGSAESSSQNCDEANREGRDVVVKSHTRHYGPQSDDTVRHRIKEATPCEIQNLELSEDERRCPICGRPMVQIGVETQLEIVFYPIAGGVRKINTAVYACRDSSHQYEPAKIIKAKRKQRVIPGSYMTPEFLACIMVCKYLLGLPLYRIEKMLRAAGLPVPRQIMSNGCIIATEKYLRPVVELLYEKLLERMVLHADETKLRVLRDSDGNSDHSLSYVWLYCTGNDGREPIVIYNYCPDHRGVNVRNFLKDYHGYLQSDGYQVYHSLPEDIENSGCWAHVRRKCEHAAKDCNNNSPDKAVSLQGLEYCNELFAIEDELKDLTPEQRYIQRQIRAKPKLDEIHDWLTRQKPVVHEATNRAIKYMRDQWPYLTRYIEDGRLEISNNRAERHIKTFVIDRKNFLFSNTPKGAECSADILSILVTAQETGLDPFKYLVWLFSNAPEDALTDKDWAKNYLPSKAPAECWAHGKSK